jgi:Xaa-Pro aminopeptidase
LGRPPEICKIMYSKTKQIADRLIEIMRPGIRCNHLYNEACNLAEQLGMGSHFMRLGEHREKVPFIGHGVGLEVNEPPLLSSNNKEILEEGMIVALELEMCGSVGEVVKLEDTLLITPDGGELLTVTSRDLVQI